jgi:hypothetical protein
MKDQLAQLIEAYAAARMTNNATLVQFAATQLNRLLESVDVVSSKSEETSSEQRA